MCACDVCVCGVEGVRHLRCLVRLVYIGVCVCSVCGVCVCAGCGVFVCAGCEAPKPVCLVCSRDV